MWSNGPSVVRHFEVRAEAGQVWSEGLRRLQDRSGELISWYVNRPFGEHERVASTQQQVQQLSGAGLHAG